MASNFLEVALRNAARGFRVIPLRGKEAFLRGWPQLATTDEKQIREWALKFPDYNCGVAGGPDISILDSDRVGRLRELCGENWAEWFHTYSVSSGRPDRAHFYFITTRDVSEFGNRKHKEPGTDGNIFEIKTQGAQVTAEGSTHPDTGGVYKVTQDLALIPFPVGLMALIRELYGKANPGGKREWKLPVHDGEGRDDFLIQQAGKLRHAGASEAIILAHLEEINEDPQIMADPKSDDDLKRIARSAARYDVPEPVGEVVFGKTVPTPKPAPLPQHVRPIYPVEVWDGTAAGEFGKLCAHDNNIPRKFYVEAFLCCLGAVVGDRITCPVDGVLPRSYTVIIAPKGKGKGSSIRRAVQFFSQAWDSSRASAAHGIVVSNTPALLQGAQDFIWKPQGIGARNASASSAPGMIRLTQELKKTQETSPNLCWGSTLPRILSVHEEFKTFLSTLFIEGGTGMGMDGVICQLWDDVSFSAPGTDKRPAVYGEMMFSLLAGVTEEDWFDLLSRGNAVGGGLMSRFNLIGTEGGFQNVSRMTPPSLTDLQETFLPRVRLLADAGCRVHYTQGADLVISEWVANLPEGSERMNVHAWRNALRLAWLRREDAISEKTAHDAVLLGQYQVDSHEYYRTKKLDTPNARVQEKILRTLKMKGPLGKRDLQRLTNAHRDGTELWNRALAGLVQDGRVGKRDDGVYYLADE